jgi:cell division protein FtsB
MFFKQEKGQFFRPLTSKYREQVLECLKELYRRLYSSTNADYGQALERDLLIDIFQEALVRAPELSGSEESEARFRHHRDKATWVINLLLEHGWLEKQVDEATLQSTYGFSRVGRQFTEPFIDGSANARTRHRNTRNTRNALVAFIEHQEVYDLLDAYEYSERIISDFTDVIAELDERKRELVSEMEGKNLVKKASDEFFDFMEKRFQPDLAVRLSADNVEKYRDRISMLIKKIKKLNTQDKANAERRLRELLPELIQPGQSVLYFILDGIEQRLRNASEIMLPALRRALQGFTKRADIIIRQMSYLASQQHNDVLAVCKQLASLSLEQQNNQLSAAGEKMAVARLGFVDPGQIKLQAPRHRNVIETMMDDQGEDVDTNARKEIFINQLLDQAFFINDKWVKDYLVKNLSEGKTVNTCDLPVENAQDLLAVANIIGVGSANGLSSEFRFDVRYTGTSSQTDYFLQQDSFSIELVTTKDNNLKQRAEINGTDVDQKSKESPAPEKK